MSPKTFARVVGVLAVAMLAAASLACGGSSAAVPPPPAIILSLSSTSATVEESTTAQFTAMLSNDTSGQGVKWTISCAVSSCGTVSPAATPSGTPTTYTAPGPPASDLNVNLIATSVADSTKSMTIAITVPAITLSLSPASANVQAGTTLQISGTVNNDASNGNVTWTLMQNGSACSPGCGTVVPTSTADGSATTYSAPATPPATNMSITVTGTSVTDTTKSASVTVIVPSVGITVTPATPSVLANTTGPLTANLVNDPSGKGVTWTVTCATAPCGSVSPTGTLSGAPTTYSAPPPPGSDLQVTVTATSVADPAAMASALVTVPAITVGIQPSGATVTATTTQSLAATVGNDVRGGGVTWQVACSATACGGVAPTSSASGGAVTYTAPGLPASDLGVTVTATSVTDTTKSGTASITVPSIHVSAVSPPTALVPLSATEAFVATITYDPSNQGINWALTQNGTACSPACGTVTATTASAAPATFTAPSTMPANTSVMLSATSVTDSTKTNSATITLASGTVELAPDSLGFSCKAPRCTAGPQNVTLTNTGATALDISSITASTGFGQTNTCGTSVLPTSSCTITVTLTTRTAGSRRGTVTITDSSSDSPQKVTLSANVRSVALIQTTGAQAELASTNSAAVPAPSGQSVIGTRVLEFVDTARPDPYLSDGSKRQLAIRMWYPVSSHWTGECTAAEYAPAAVWHYFAQLVGVKEFPVATNSCLDAAIAEGSHPVILLTPGYTGTFTDYSFLTEDLASHGYVVVAIDHTYEATAVEFSNGKLARSLVGSHLGDTERRDRHSLAFAVDVRMKDLQFVIGELGRLNAASQGLFAGRLDLTKTFVIGHSLGGLTALLSNDADPHVKGAVLLDPLLPDVLPGNTNKPVLMLAADRKEWGKNECQLWNNLRGPRLAVSLQGSEHVALSDWLWLAKDTVHAGAMGPEKTLSAVREYVAAFLDSNVRGEPASALLNGPSAEYPDARVIGQQQGLCGKP